MELVIISDWKEHPAREGQLEDIFAKGFAKLGHKIHWIACPINIGEDRQDLWHGHPIHLIRRGGGMHLKVAKRLQTILTHSPIELVQVRNDPLFGLIAWTLAKAHKIPFVYHLSILSGPLLVDEAGFLRGFQRYSKMIKGVFGGWLVDRIALNAPFLLAMSDAMMDLYDRKGRRRPTAALPMGFQAEDAVPRPPNTSAEINIGYIGALDAVRRIDFLLRAFAIAEKRDPRLRLHLIGSARSKADVDVLKKLAADLKLGEKALFLDPIPRQEIPRFLARIDIGASPFPPTWYFKTNSPTKLMEYLGYGLPAVANDIPEQKKVLQESGGGLCTPYEESAFAEAILKLASHPEMRAAMGESGAEYMRKHREYGVLAKRAEETYRAWLKK